MTRPDGSGRSSPAAYKAPNCARNAADPAASRRSEPTVRAPGTLSAAARARTGCGEISTKALWPSAAAAASPVQAHRPTQVRGPVLGVELAGAARLVEDGRVDGDARGPAPDVREGLGQFRQQRIHLR